MSTLLDAYAVIAVLRGEPAATDVRRLVRKGGVWTTAINAAEIVDRMVRLVGADADDIRGELVMLDVDVASVPVGMALDAGRCRAEHYHRDRCAVTLADCVAAVAARQAGAALATADPDLADLASTLGVPVTRLPDSHGHRPAEGAL